jgi:Ser/Thr protein kinase RdoA (MazF antagonist)
VTPDPLLTTPPLQATAADAAVVARDHFGIGGEVIRLAGERDDNFLIRADSGDYSLKLANPAEEVETLVAQQEALAHIARSDPEFPVPRPVPLSSGELAARIEVRDVSVAARMVTFLEGVVSSEMHPPILTGRDIGVLLGRLQDALEGFDRAGPRLDYLWNLRSLSRVRPLTEHLDATRQGIVEQWFDHFEGEVDDPLQRAPMQAIHSDLNQENLLVDPETGALTGVIDFGDLVHAPRVIDVGVAAAYHAMDGPDPLEAIVDVVSGYRAAHPLDPSEVALIPGLVMGRLIQSLTIGAFRASLHPENREYILIHADRAWTVLQSLHGVGLGAMAEAVVV